MKFSELVRVLEQNGGTSHAILKAAGIRKGQS